MIYKTDFANSAWVKRLFMQAGAELHRDNLIFDKATTNVAVTSHFLLHEFLTKDKSSNHYTILDYRLIHVILCLRESIQGAVHVTSTYRSPEYNRRVNGAVDSMHIYGGAIDFVVGQKLRRKALRFISVSPAVGGIGVYPTFFHIDNGSPRVF